MKLVVNKNNQNKEKNDTDKRVPLKRRNKSQETKREGLWRRYKVLMDNKDTEKIQRLKQHYVQMREGNRVKIEKQFGKNMTEASMRFLQKKRDWSVKNDDLVVAVRPMNKNNKETRPASFWSMLPQRLIALKTDEQGAQELGHQQGDP